MSISVSRSRGMVNGVWSGVEVVTASWATAAGEGFASDAIELGGELRAVGTIPSAANPPSDGYQIRLYDSNRLDWLNDACADCDSDVAAWAEPLVSSVTPPVLSGSYNMVISDCGSDAAGSAIFCLRR